MIGSRLKQFRIIEKIGAGGMGVVYLAHDESLERQVAVKVLPAGKLADAEARQRFRREALALSSLNHPHIATIYAFDSADDVDYLVMELVDGPTLEEKMRMGPLMEEEILRIGGQVAGAVGEAHERNIVHRDLKPANIKLPGKGEVKVLDFGLATLMKTQPPLSLTISTQTGAGMGIVAGTLPYTAPDQLRGRPPSPAADVWSLGVILYEAAAGQRPFQGMTVHEISSAILNHAPLQLPATVSTQLRGVIERCLHKDPAQRFQNAGEVKIALQTLQTSPAIAIAAQPRRSLPWLPLAIGLMLAAATVFLLTRGLGEGQGESATSLRPAIESVVAAPSTVVAGDQDDFLADAIPRTISNHLSLLDGLVTKVPPSALAYLSLGSDPSRLAAAYDVGAVVMSTITARADHLMLNVQLVETGTQRLLWGGEFEGTRDHYLDLVSEASRGVRAAVRPAARNIADPEMPQTSAAELALQRGFHHLDLYFSQGSQDDLGVAAGRFREAMDLDPALAGAAAAFAQIQLLEIGHGAEPAGALARGEMWARRAIQMDERASQAWYVLSLVESSKPDGNAASSLEFALKAATFGPLNQYAHLGLAVNLAAASCELGAAAYEEGPRINPLDLNSSAAAAGLMHMVGRSSAAVAVLDRILSIQPDLPYPLLMKTLVLIARDEPAAAADAFNSLKGITAAPFPPQIIGMVRDLLELSRAPGHEGEAPPALTRVMQLAQGQTVQFPYWDRATQIVAPLLARIGQPAAALETLEARSRLGLVEPYDMLLWIPDLGAVRSDPRFAPIMEAARIRFEGMVAILEAARSRGELPTYLDRALTELRDRLSHPA